MNIVFCFVFMIKRQNKTGGCKWKLFFCNVASQLYEPVNMIDSSPSQWLLLPAVQRKAIVAMWWRASHDQCIAPAAVLHPDHCSERWRNTLQRDLFEPSASVVTSGVGKWKSGGINLTLASSRCGNRKAVSSHLAAESIVFCRNRWWHSVMRWKNPTDKQRWTILKKTCTYLFQLGMNHLSDIYCFILLV